MRAVLCKEWGGPEDLAIGEIESRDPGPGEIRVAIKAAGVNFADTLMIAGKYQEKPDFPFSPGLEAAGEVIAVGEGVEHLAEGERVMAMCGYGGFAEECTMEAARAVRIPDNMDFVDAAAFPVAYGTSHVGLERRANLQPGETLLVHGASGGVGLTAVEIGKVMGATVIGTGGSDEKLEIVTAYGADHVINYAQEDVRERVLALTGGKGADVIYDPVGGDVFDASLRCIAWEGRLIVVGFASGRIPEAPANRLLIKNCAAIGLFWGAYAMRDPKVIVDSFGTLLGWYAEGRLKPHVSHTFPMERAGEALNTLLSRKATGKVVLTME